MAVCSTEKTTKRWHSISCWGWLFTVLCTNILLFSLIVSEKVVHASSSDTRKYAVLRQLKSPNGRNFSFSLMHEATVPIVFLCGCGRCQSFAAQWANEQRKNAAGTEQLVIVYSGNREAAASFGAIATLADSKTIMLCDPKSVAKHVYHVDDCPTVFVVCNGTTVYHNQAPAVYSPRLPNNFVSDFTIAINTSQSLVVKPLVKKPQAISQ